MYKSPFNILLTLLTALSFAMATIGSLADDIPKNSIINERTGESQKTKRFSRQEYKGRHFKVFKQVNKGVPSFSDRAPRKSQDYEVLTYKCYVCDVNSKIDWHSIKIYPDKYSNIINHAASLHKLDHALIRAIIHAESAFRPSVKSHKGAVGLMQLMPVTAEELGVTDRTNPQQNINGGAKYLSQLIKRFDGNIELATAAYNAGPTAVQRYGDVPPYPETQAYIKRVGILTERYKQ